MRKLIVLHRILKRTKAYYILALFVIFILIAAGLIYVFEPGINNYGDALWFSYATLFTIGYGDVIATSMLARVIAVLISIYATIVIALVTGVIVLFYQEHVSQSFNEAREEALERLKHVDEMSKDKLKELAEKIRKLDK